MKTLSVYLTVAFLILSALVSAQCTLTGKVIDKHSREGVAYANVSLIAVNDSSLVTGTISNNSGSFKIKNIAAGNYHVKISFIGYQPRIISNVLLESGTRNIGETEIQLLTENLAEVTATSNKLPLSYKVDRKVIDAESFPAADAAIDLLENVPSVQVDLDGNLTYRGDGTFLVYINGHQVSNGTEKLRQLSTSRIDRIEIITNPSAKYDADGTAGIIQIILKKNRLEGYAINSSIKTNTLGGNELLFSIDNKTERSGWYVNGSWGKSIWGKTDETNEQSITSNNITYLSLSDMKTKYYQNKTYLELGFNYDLTDKDFIDFSGYLHPTVTREKYKQKGWYTEQEIDETGDTTTSSYYYDALTSSTYQYIGGTFTYEHAFNKSHSHLLSAYFDYSDFLSDFEKTEVDEKDYGSYNEREGYIKNENNEIEMEGRLNYKIPLGSKTTLESGAEMDADHIPEITSTSGTWDENSTLTKYDDDPANQVVDFTQNIYSTYVIFKREGEKLAIQLGARMEFTHRDIDYSYQTNAGEQVNTSTKKNFNDFFPSTHFTYNLTKNQQLYTSYSRRIKRPSYWNLIPIVQYNTLYTYYTGNGDLIPSYSNNWEVGYKKSWKRNFISGEFFARKTKNVMQNYTYTMSEDVLLFSPENVGKSTSIGVEFMAGINIFPWWNSNLSSNLYSYKLDIDFDDVDETQSEVKKSMRWNNTFVLPKSFTLKWDLNYKSPVTISQAKREGYFYSNLALKKEIMDGKWAFTAVYSDIFSSVEYTTNYYGDGFSITKHTDNQPYFSLKVAYSFDNQK